MATMATAILNDIKILELEEYFITMPATPPEIVAKNSPQHLNNVDIHKYIFTHLKDSPYISKIEKIETMYAMEIYNNTMQKTPTNMVMVHYLPPYGTPYEDISSTNAKIHKHLLLLIKQLQTIHICLFDISPNNIHFHFKNGEWMPVIHDFSHAFIYRKTLSAKTQCMLTIAPTIPLTLPSKTLEIWVIRALLQTNATHLTPTLLETVTSAHTNITPDNPFLHQCNTHSYKLISKFINHTVDDIINHFWQPIYHKGWPVYSAMYMIAVLQHDATNANIMKG